VNRALSFSSSCYPIHPPPSFLGITPCTRLTTWFS
jgi:phosphoenolpyruvate carboxylase